MKNARALRAGFSLIEMLVALGIIGVISTIVFVSQSSFDKTIILTNTAYDVALTIRNIETYGLGSRAVEFEGTTIKNAGHGVHFASANTSSFSTFVDSSPIALLKNPPDCNPPRDEDAKDAPDAHPGDCVFTVEKDILVQTFTLGNGVKIAKFCTTVDGTSWKCSTDESNPLTSLDITFVRPNADITMVTKTYKKNFEIVSACIVLTARGGTRYITTHRSGLITVSVTVPAESTCEPQPQP